MNITCEVSFIFTFKEVYLFYLYIKNNKNIFFLVPEEILKKIGFCIDIWI
jgi:hypothetical protein